MFPEWQKFMLHRNIWHLSLNVLVKDYFQIETFTLKLILLDTNYEAKENKQCIDG